jgi:hypothetical protein
LAKQERLRSRVDPPEEDRAPITSAHYRLCPVSGGECHSSDRSALEIGRVNDLTVPAAGEWDVRLWRGDAAGNQEAGNASVPVRLRFDPEPPTLGFEPDAANDPTRVSVLVEDRVSGLAGGTVEISRQGSGAWQALDPVVDRQSGRLLTPHQRCCAAARRLYATRHRARPGDQGALTGRPVPRPSRAPARSPITASWNPPLAVPTVSPTAACP